MDRLGRISNTLETFITFLSPQWGAKRSMAREAVRVMNRSDFENRLSSRSASTGFDALQGNRLNADWNSDSASADAAISGDLGKLRNRVRDLYRNNPYVARLIDAKVDGVISTGLRPQARVRENEVLGILGDAADRFNSEAEQLYRDWSLVADAGGRMTFEEIQALAERKYIEDGEIFARLVNVDDDTRPVPLAVMPYEADQINTPSDRTDDPRIRNGIQVGEWGEPVGYWVQKTHPGDSRARKTEAEKDYEYVPLRNDNGEIQMIHVFRPLRPGQTRGYSPVAPAIGVLQDLHRYWEAEIVAARAAACSAMFIKTSSPNNVWNNLNKSTTENGQTQKITERTPGMVHYLAENEDVTFGDPNRPNQSFGAFTETLVRAVGLAGSLPFELLALDFSKTNYSSARAALIEAHAHFKCDTKMIADRFCSVVWRELVRSGVGHDVLPAPTGFTENFRQWTRSSWTHPGYQWIDPAREAQGASIRLQEGISTLREIVEARGGDIDEHLDELKAIQDKLDEMGLELPKPKRTESTTTAIQEEENEPA